MRQFVSISVTPISASSHDSLITHVHYLSAASCRASSCRCRACWLWRRRMAKPSGLLQPHHLSRGSRPPSDPVTWICCTQKVEVQGSNHYLSAPVTTHRLPTPDV